MFKLKGENVESKLVEQDILKIIWNGKEIGYILV